MVRGYRWLWSTVANRKGFSLVELMVVIILLGIITAIALPRFMGQVDKGKESAALADLYSMKAVVETYYAEASTLPKSEPGSDAGKIQKVMNDGGINWGALEDPWGNAYYYLSNTNEWWYIIYARREDNTGYFFVTDRHTPTKGSWPNGYGNEGAGTPSK